MSNFYLDVLKDRLYVENKNSATRRAAQSTIYRVLETLTLLVAPILAFTADEIWQFMPHRKEHDTRNVVFNSIPEAKTMDDEALLARWEKIHAIRDDVKKALELARGEKIIGASLDAGVTLYAKGEMYDFINSIRDIMPGILLVSQFTLENEGEGSFKGELEDLSVTVAHAEGKKCARCWSYSATVGTVSGHDDICERCARVLEEN